MGNGKYLKEITNTVPHNSHTQINSVQIFSKCLKKQIASRFFFILCHSPNLYILQSDLEKWEMGNT